MAASEEPAKETKKAMDIKVGRYGKNEGYVVWHDNGQGTPVVPNVDGLIFTDGGKVMCGTEEVGIIDRFWQGWIEDAAHTWIAYIDRDGRPTFYLDRDEQGGIEVWHKSDIVAE